MVVCPFFWVYFVWLIIAIFITLDTQWESFKAALHLSAKPMKIKANPKAPRSDADREAYFQKLGTRRIDSFTLADHTSQTLTEQLTLMQQVHFEICHKKIFRFFYFVF